MNNSITRMTGITLAIVLAAGAGSAFAADAGQYEPAPTGAVERIGAAVKSDDQKAEPTSAPQKVVGKGSGPEKRDFKIISESEARKQGTLGGKSGGSNSTGDSTGGTASGAGNSGN